MEMKHISVSSLSFIIPDMTSTKKQAHKTVSGLERPWAERTVVKHTHDRKVVVLVLATMSWRIRLWTLFLNVNV